MPRPSSCDRIREFDGLSLADIPLERHVLDFDKTCGSPRGLQQHIDARIPTVKHLASHARIAAELGDAPFDQGFDDQAIRTHRIDADECPPDSDQLPAVRE